MKQRIFVTLLILSCFTSIVMAGTTGKISGRIIDGESGEPLPGANVVIENSTMGAATDVEGYYYIINVYILI